MSDEYRMEFNRRRWREAVSKATEILEREQRARRTEAAQDLAFGRLPPTTIEVAIVEREGPDPDEGPRGPVNRCRNCPAEGVGMILHPDPFNSDPRRCICGTCQGEANARRMRGER